METLYSQDVMNRRRRIAFIATLTSILFVLLQVARSLRWGMWLMLAKAAHDLGLGKLGATMLYFLPTEFALAMIILAILMNLRGGNVPVRVLRMKR